MILGKSSDPLEEVLSQRSTGSLYRIAQSRSNFFKTQKFDYEYFGLSFMQRIVAFIGCVVAGIILFMISFYRIMFIAINPTGFVAPYVLSNFLFFMMFGFLSGFRTYFRKLFSKEKRSFTIAFLTITLATMHSAFILKKSIYIFCFGIVQVVVFMAFLATFIPGGAAGLTSLLNMVIKG